MNYLIMSIQYLKKAIRFIIFLAITIPLAAACSTVKVKPKEPVDYVNPYMGNISHLLVPTFPTVHLPNSLLRIYPDKGFYAGYTGDRLNGLPAELTSHRGNLAFKLSPFHGDLSGIKPVLSYSYDQEKVTPYSYSVFLDEEGIKVRFAPSHQSAMYEMEFRNDDSAYLIINSQEGFLRWNGEALAGYQKLGNNTKVYLWLETEVKPIDVGVLSDGKVKWHQTEANGKDAAVLLSFGEKASVLRVRYGISFIDEVQAKKNLMREIASYNIKSLIEEGRNLWNEALGKITVEGGSNNDKGVFYTSLYRVYERPVCISEDGRYYSAFDGKVHEDQGIPFYTDDWIWDTYRAAHPLRVLIDPQTETNILNSYIRMAEQSDHFWMPTFPVVTGDNHAMNCNHGVASILDAYRKGLREFDLGKAYKACKGAITEKTLIPWSAKPAGELDRFYWEHGYFPALREGEPETVAGVNPFEKRQAVAVTTGTSFDAWCLSQIAKELNYNDDYQFFLKHSYNYRNLFNRKNSSRLASG